MRLNRYVPLLTIMAASAFVAPSTHASQCELTWRVDRGGEYTAALEINPADGSSTWSENLTTHREGLPGPLQTENSVVQRLPSSKASVRYEFRGLIRDAERTLGDAILEWLATGGLADGPVAECLTKRLEIRTPWRYEHIPSGGSHKFGNDAGSTTATMAIRRLSAERDLPSQRDFYGIEIESTISAEVLQQREAFHRWTEKILLETDLKEPGVPWNDRPTEVALPVGPRAELSLVLGSYAPADRPSFGIGIRGDFIDESALSSTISWRRTYFGARAIMADPKAQSAGREGTSIFDFHLTTGLHWRPKFHANTAYVAGIRNFLSLSTAVGFHRVFAKTGNPTPVNQTFTSPSADIGFFWGAYNRKMDLMIGLEAHYLRFLTDAEFGSNYEFALSFGF